MAWIEVIAAGLIEILFAYALSKATGFDQVGWILTFIVAATTSLLLLQHAMRTIPVGTAYAVWAGIGTAGTATFGIVALGESARPLRLLCIAAIIIAVMGLQFVDSQRG